VKSEDTPHISPQTAMDDYFQDMFGHVADDPLKKLEAQEQAAREKPQATLPEHQSRQASSKAKPKKATKRQVTDFADPQEKAGNISSLIIPAAFPKLAPLAVEQTVKIAEKVVQTETVAVPSVAKTKPLTATRQKLDKKTALSILLKQQQKLSSTQRARLKEKMKQLENKKNLATQTQAVQAITTEQITSVQVQPEPLTSSVVHKTKTESYVAPVLASASHAPAQPVSSKNVRPEWSSRRFECLLFSVAGLKLAVPLISLGAIYKIEKDFTPLVGRANWFMGLYHHLDRNVRVVDTAQWVMPERCTEQVRNNYKFIIRLGDSDWGMACDAVHQSIQLYPDQVKWRSERTKRVWLFGTVIDHMCALIDADALNSMLEQQAPINFSH